MPERFVATSRQVLGLIVHSKYTSNTKNLRREKYTSFLVLFYTPYTAVAVDFDVSSWVKDGGTVPSFKARALDLANVIVKNVLGAQLAPPSLSHI